MKSLKLAVNVALISCVVVFCGSAMADPGAGAAGEEALQADRVEMKPVLEDPAEVAALENQELAEPALDSSLLFGPFLFTVDDVLPPAVETEAFTPELPLPKICVPNFCQRCDSDADCFGGNRCRAVQCP